MEDIRLPLPAAYADPAFINCLHAAIGAHELVEQFDRLYGASLSKRANEKYMRAFTQFVHESIYMPLSADALAGLRAGRA